MCSFSSINRGLLLVHQAKHDAVPQNTAAHAAHIESSKIKVKSSLLLAHSTAVSDVKELDDVTFVTTDSTLHT